MLRKVCYGSLVVLFVAGLFLGLPRGAFACSCMMPPDPHVALDKADAVFAGTVISIVDRNTGPMSSSADPLFTTFQVNSVWKGNPSPSTTVTSARNDASCGYAFEQGREYIVYASVFEGQLGTNICTRTARLADAQVDVAALGAGRAVAQPAPVPSPMPWLMIGVAVAIIAAIIVFGAGLFRVRSKLE